MTSLLAPGTVLASYAEPLLEGRRAVVFGDATSGIAEELLERGARSVHVFDPEPTRAAEAAAQNRMKAVTIVPLDEADIAVRDGAFDVALVTDLSAAENPARLLGKVKGALGARGKAFIASPNPDVRLALVPRTSSSRGGSPLGYYELYDVVAAEFPEVRMMGQTPFVGYAIVDFAPEGEPAVSLDSSLVPGGAEEPEWFVAVAGREPTELEPFAIVQLPARQVLASASGGKLAEELRGARAEETRLAEQVAELEAKLEGLRAKAKAKEHDGEKERARLAREGLERELAQKDLRIVELDRRVAELSARSATAEASAQKSRDDIAPLLRQVDAYQALEPERQALTSELTRLSTERDEFAGKLANSEARVQSLTEAAASEAPDDLGRLEAALRDGAERVRRLEAELGEAERIGRELVRELAAREGQGPGGSLASENARLKADLEALGWTLDELEGRLARANGAGAPAAATR